MAKKKQPTRRHRTVALKGMTPDEVEAWRKAEIRERAAEARREDAELRKSGKKPGRPKGQKRLYREATRDTRKAEIKAQDRERNARALRRGSRSGVYTRLKPGTAQVSKTVRSGIEKTVFRIRGAGSWQKAVDSLTALPKGTSAYVQLGSGYGKDARWVSSRLNEPVEAAGWLEGIGLKYTPRIFQGVKKQNLFIEFVAFRKVASDGRKERRGGSRSKSHPRSKSPARKESGAVKKGGDATRRNTRGKGSSGKRRK